jgi:methionyl-tRNA formyltransferase
LAPTARIVLACNTERGRRVLVALAGLVPGAALVVFCGHEEGGEPAFVTAMEREAEAAGAAFQQTTSLDAAAGADLLLMVNWRRIVPMSICRSMTLGAFVFHDSLLPEYRGFSPTVWAVVNGEDHTGATLIEAAEHADEGEIVDQARVAIGPEETIAGVIERVTETYLDLLRRNLPALLDGSAPRRPQDHARATLARRRTPDDNRIDWAWPAARIHDLVRGTTRPYAGAFTSFEGHLLRVWAARPDTSASGSPGQVLAADPERGTLVATGSAGLWISELEFDAPVPASGLEPGARLG